MIAGRQKDKVFVDPGVLSLKFSNVFYIPVFHMSTLSCTRLDKHGILTNISNGVRRFIGGENKNRCICHPTRRNCDCLHTMKLAKAKDKQHIELNMKSTKQGQIHPDNQFRKDD